MKEGKAQIFSSRHFSKYFLDNFVAFAPLSVTHSWRMTCSFSIKPTQLTGQTVLSSPSCLTNLLWEMKLEITILDSFNLLSMSTMDM